MTLMKRSPKNCVWEITLACNAKCVHCGSHAGPTRSNELSTDEALRLIDDLAEIGCEEITLSGGEPLMREDWPMLAAHVRENHMKLAMITNGLLVEEQANVIARSDFFSIGFSIDGPRDVHDRIRRVEGGFERIIKGVKTLVDRGVLVGAVTHINKLNLDRLDELHDLLVEVGFEGWQLQLTMPQGRASEHREELCIDLDQLPIAEKKLVALRRRTPLFFQTADNWGYMSKSEPRLRAGTPRADKFFTGCTAGLGLLGITSDGTVRGCLSMPPSMNEGNIRERSLKDIWNDQDLFSYNRRFKVSDLTDSCAGCAFGKICRGGCKSMAMAVTGTTTSNPYCLHSISKSNSHS